jgi:chromosome segregation ATPase
MDTALHLDTAPSFDDIVKAWDDSRSGPKPQKQLAAIAVKVQLDGFDSIKKACNNMIADLEKQQADEVKTKSTCVSNMNTNDKDVYAANETLQDTQENIEDLETQISELTDAITQANDDVSNTQVAIKTAGLARQEENQAYQEEVNDQRAIQLILGKAIARMAQVYKASLVQTRQSPPLKTAPKKNANGSPVISMMESVVEDSKALESEAMNAETAAQQAYATFVNDASNSIDELKSAIKQKSGYLATARANKEAAEAQHFSVTNRLEDLSDYRYDLHQECDYVMKNFEKRQEARLQEIEAIKKALNYLAGMM